MINSAKCNMYEVGETRIRELYADSVRATGNELLLAISRHALEPNAVDALEKTANFLGYGTHACAYAVIDTYDTADLLNVIEGLDPLALIVTDTYSASLLSSAYRCDVENDAVDRILGRIVVAFRDFGLMLDSSEKKQRAWFLLKKLPKLN